MMIMEVLSEGDYKKVVVRNDYQEWCGCLMMRGLM